MYEYRIKKETFASGRERFTVLRKLKDHAAGGWRTCSRDLSSRAEALTEINVHRMLDEDVKRCTITYEDVD